MVEMAKYNIRQAVVVAIDPYIPTEALAYECLKTKDILIPFGSVDPKSRDWKEELEKTLTLPIAGFNIHFALQEELLNTEISRQIIEIISEKRPKLPIYVHTGNFQIFKHTDKKWATSLGVLAKEFSEQTFICGHAGWSEPSLALRLALRCPNVILETSWQPARVIRRLCDRLGPRRLLLGSDYPLYSMRRAIGNCRRALNPKEFTMVSNENAKSLIKQGLSRQGLHSF
jgi:predicted TIM-barrel fold metal-dependent hydrolase